MRRTLPLIFLAALFLMASAPCALADGCFFPEKTCSKLPAIPSQRALVVHRLGIERLIVESSFDGEGRDFGWIVPVPEKPLDIQAVNAGFLETLSLCAQPKIVSDRKKEKDFWLCIAAVTTIWLLVIIIVQPSSTVASVSLGVAITCTCMACSGFVSLRGQQRSAVTVSSAGIRVERQSTVGNYQISVLDADSAESLNTWLRGSGLREIPAEGAPIVEAYIKKKWHFITARLTREGSGLSKPHPLEIGFLTDSPVYPIRMTSLAGSPVRLELYVISGQRAKVRPLTMEFCDYYESKSINESHDAKWRGLSTGGRDRVIFRARETGQEIGHPRVSSYLWNGAVLTRCTGTLSPKQMSGSDLNIALEPYLPLQKQYYSKTGAKDTAVLFSLWLWSIVVPAVIFVFYGNLRGAENPVVFFSRIVVPSLLLCLLIPVLGPAVIPTVKTENLGDRSTSQLYTDCLKYSVESALSENRKDFEKMSEAELPKWFITHLDSYYREMSPGRQPLRNYITNREFTEEDSPGNFTILSDKRGIVFRTYTSTAIPIDVVLKNKDGSIPDSSLPSRCE